MKGIRIVAFVPDLMDRSRLTGAAVDGDVHFVSGLRELGDHVSDADVVVVDLARPGVIDALPDLVAQGPRVVGFGAHVDGALLAAARAAGAAVVLRRSAFFAAPRRWLP